MRDLLLKFPSREVAIAVGEQLGVTTNDETIQANNDLAISVIGKHNDAHWWVMIRFLVPYELPEALNDFIFWDSNSGLVRDLTNTLSPNNVWLGD